MVVYRNPIEALGIFEGSDGVSRRDGPFETIHLDDLRAWSRTDDLETLGAVAEILTSERPNARLHPQMPEAERREFLMRYLGRCIREDPEGEWASPRFEAAGLAQDLLMRSRKSADPEAFAQIKEWLADLYLTGDAEVRHAVAVTVLERPFGQDRIRKRFDGWLEHPVLRTAYLTASRQM